MWSVHIDWISIPFQWTENFSFFFWIQRERKNQLEIFLKNIVIKLIASLRKSKRIHNTLTQIDDEKCFKLRRHTTKSLIHSNNNIFIQLMQKHIVQVAIAHTKKNWQIINKNEIKMSVFTIRNEMENRIFAYLGIKSNICIKRKLLLM